MIVIAEYRYEDKSRWTRGPWDREPDKVQMRDEETGLPCLIVRGPSGALCGYVGVPMGHPWFGKDYDSCGLTGDKPEGYEPDWYIEVHGGLTYADACQHSADGHGICHTPEPGEPDNIWWLGFDCAHLCDMSGMAWGRAERFNSTGIYRDLDYVKAECANLARQAAAVATQ